MVDRISILPDELLCHILSFLPTEQSVATSVLSKRWRPLWPSVPVLDYDNRSNPRISFERLIYATLLAGDRRQHIRSFRLRYQVDDRESANADVNIWVNIAIQRGIENLEIEIKPVKISLRSSILSCRTLVVLKLRNLALRACSSVELPSLKTLHLKSVKFEKPQYLMELLNGCSLLEDLKIFGLDYPDGGGSFCKEQFKNLPNLVRASICGVATEITDILLNAMPNVEFMEIEEIHVNDEVPELPCLRHLTLLEDLRSWHSVFLMLNNCPKLESFELARCYEPEFVLPYPQFLPECLTSCLTKCYCTRSLGTESDIQFAKYIMQNSTYLQCMKIHFVTLTPLEVLIKELALCPRKSASCKLSVEDITYDFYARWFGFDCPLDWI